MQALSFAGGVTERIAHLLRGGELGAKELVVLVGADEDSEGLGEATSTQQRQRHATSDVCAHPAWIPSKQHFEPE
eukprot:CAMPEP_0181304590 /NCGR_PEP_ID=MMETSP1101-20121128/9238_1 /TAXON_ID=46948 /ORGANISM="Rhodomonas abbreviata, Strain Caron Lab Isolate" /LENGTH=74 /DNA_ID=CAMNT_0023410371 /DNA_START=180 /DNA_END=405 /DNA_ORIENTATION=-